MRPSAAALAAYAAPAAPLAALYFPVYVYVPPFYAERGVPLAALGALLIAVRLLDAVTDPAMGWIADRRRGEWARRRLWMAVSAPLVAVSVWMLLVPPTDAGFAHAAVWLVALTLAWTIAMTPYYAWGAEIDPDYAGRARVTGWREAAALLGTVAAVVLYNLAPDGDGGLRAVALFVAVALPAGALWALAAAPRPADAPAAVLRIGPLLAALRRNGPFRRLLLAYFVNGCANALPAGLFLFFIEDYLGAPGAGWLLLAYFVCAVAAMPLWAWASRRHDKHRVWCVAMLACCAAFAGVLALEPGDVAGYAAVCVLTGLMLGADLSLPPAIQADVVELHAVETGEQAAGLFFALWSVATKAALAVAGGLALVALDAAGFVAGAPNEADALGALVLLYGGAPILLKLLAIALMWRFPLGREAHATLREAVRA